MSSKEQKAMERLVAKLSAVRKTLRGEERRLLDRMVTSAQVEVELHSSKAEAKNQVAAKGKLLRQKAESAKAEVELHSSQVSSQNAGMATQGAALEKLWRSQTAGKLLRVHVNSKSGKYEVLVD